MDQPLEDVQQRDVGFGDRLEEPILFEEIVVLRVAHERQVRVQDEREVTARHEVPFGRSAVRHGGSHPEWV